MNTLLGFIAEKYYHCTRRSGVDHSQQSQQASKEIPQRNTVDPIRFRCLRYIRYIKVKLIRYVFAYKKQFKGAASRLNGLKNLA